MKLVCEKIGDLTEKKHVLFTSNCSTAIYLLLKSLNFKKKKNYCSSKYMLRRYNKYFCLGKHTINNRHK